MNEKMKILIGYDGSGCADAALDDLQRAGLPHEAEAVVISVADVFLPPPLKEGDDTFPFQVSDGVRRARARAARAIEEIRGFSAQASDRVKTNFPDWNVRTEACVDSPAWAMIKKADEWKPDLIVVGSHGRSAIGRLILGSVSQKVLTEARCSVRVARGQVDEPDTPVRNIIGIDGTPDSGRAVRAVAERVWPEHSEVRLVTAIGGFHMYGLEPDVQMAHAHEIQQAAETELRTAGIQFSSVIKEGDPKSVLTGEAEAWGADCIFVGAKGHRFLERFLLGSVSAAVATRAHCSVEVVRPRADAHRENQVR